MHVSKYRIANFEFALSLENDSGEIPDIMAEFFRKVFANFSIEDCPNTPLNLKLVGSSEVERSWPLTRGQLDLQKNGFPVFHLKGVSFSSLSPDLASLYDAEIAIINYATSLLKNKIWIHGACLVKENKLVLLIAPSGVGKTTLSLGLLDHGFRLLTDDVIIFDPAEQLILSYPRCPKVRPPTHELLPEIGLTNAETIGEFLVLPKKYIEKSAQNILNKDICIFFLLKMGESKQSNPKKIDYSPAIIELLKHSNLLYQDEQLLTFSSLFDKATFHNLYIDTIQNNLQQILEQCSLPKSSF